MKLSRLENNFQRLLRQCKKLARDRKAGEMWRLEKYVSHLGNMFVQLETDYCQIKDDVLAQYRKELEFLKGLISADKKLEVGDKAMAAQQLPVRCLSDGQDGIVLRQAKTRASAKYTSDMRRELLGEFDGALRLENAGDSLNTDSADIDAVLKHHHDLQTKLADDFLKLTRNLKENVTVAGHVVREDNKEVNITQIFLTPDFSKPSLSPNVPYYMEQFLQATYLKNNKT